MNNHQSKAIYENFNSQLTAIEQDMVEIAQMAATVSEKFNGVGQNIQNFAAIARFGRKGLAAATIIGGAVKIFGDVYAELKKEEALKKLLPKKVEIAEAKTAVIQNFLQTLEGKKEEFRTLLQQEIAKEFIEEGRAEYQELYGEACQNSFALYVRTMYTIEICKYMLAEFAAWKMGQHESNIEKPDKAVVLEDVLTMITTPESLIDPKNNKLTGGIYLLSQNEPLFAALINKLHSNASATEKKQARRVANRKSFIDVKIFVEQLRKIEKSKDVTHLDWLKTLPTFHQAVKNIELTPLFLYLMKYYGIGYFILFFFIGSSMQNNSMDIIFAPIIYSLIVMAITIPISLIIFYIYENDNAGRGLVYHIIFLIFTILTFGLMPIAFKRYLAKERNYEEFLIQLKLKINE